MINSDKITEIFYVVHEFCNEFDKAMAGHIVKNTNEKTQRNRSFKLHDSEVIIIFILFHIGQFRNLKHCFLFALYLYLISVINTCDL